MTRATLFVLGPQEHVLLCVTHHIASDGWSVGIFCRDVSELYTAHIEGREARLPDLPRQYRDFVSWQRERLTGAHLDAQLAYWRSQLAGAPTVLELPTPRARTPHQTFEGASLPVELPADLAAAVLARSREASVTPYMLLLAVFSLLLYRRTGQDDILVGSPFANRSRAEFEELVGFVANTLVLRVQLAGNPTFSTLLGRVRETTLGALDHQEVPFDHVVEAMRVQRRQDVNPLVQVNFRARVEEPATLQLPGATTSRVAVDAGFAAFELALDLHVLEEAIVGELLYNVELFDLPSAVRLADDYAALLGQVLKEPGSRLLDLEVPNESIPATDDAAPAAGSIRGFRKAADRDEAAAGESR
jgi:hypothetical protein